jgi:Ca2+-binding EF-hand superfamily protein
MQDPSQSLRIDQSITLDVDQNKFQSAKNKFENYIRQHDTSLATIFAILDTDSNAKIDFPEFSKKIKALHMHLEIDEISALFKSMDINGNGSINYTELVEMFASINTA